MSEEEQKKEKEKEEVGDKKDLREEIRERMEKRREDMGKKGAAQTQRGKRKRNPMAQMMKGMMAGRGGPARGNSSQEELIKGVKKMRNDIQDIKGELREIKNNIESS